MKLNELLFDNTKGLKEIFDHFKYPMDQELPLKQRKFTQRAAINFY